MQHEPRRTAREERELGRAICRVFGINPDDLLSGEQNTPSPARGRGAGFYGNRVVTGSYWHPSRLN